MQEGEKEPQSVFFSFSFMSTPEKREGEGTWLVFPPPDIRRSKEEKKKIFHPLRVS